MDPRTDSYTCADTYRHTTQTHGHTHGHARRHPRTCYTDIHTYTTCHTDIIQEHAYTDTLRHTYTHMTHTRTYRHHTQIHIHRDTDPQTLMH